MTEVIGVRFKKVGKVYYFAPNGIRLEKEQPVIVETTRGLEYGEVTMANSMVEDNKIVQPLKQVVRAATEADKKTMEQNLKFEKDAFQICEEKIAKHNLEMKLVTVEYTFDRSKILFYFSADGRVDFRELVKDLAGVFRTRIELRQIGVRDEAKMIGGLGICGCPLCCSTFLENFQPVSINMAKDQGLSLNPTKISGTCGRLMCCLKYENDAYQELLKETPPNDSLVDTPYGRGVVMDSSLLRGSCRVRLQNNPDSPVTVPCSECAVLRRKNDRNTEPLPAPAAPAAPKEQPVLLESFEAASLAAEASPEAAPAAESTTEKPADRKKPRPRRDANRKPQHHDGEKPEKETKEEAASETREQKPHNHNRRNKNYRSGKPDQLRGEKSEKADGGERKPSAKPQNKPEDANRPASAANGEQPHRRRHRGGHRGGHHGGGKRPEGNGAPTPKPES